ncbi:MAG: hypothetical protein HOL01_27380 [Planctomycetaceae bacterium]|nr:hypothetical protein [Planctomycetaceae bacterium]
MPMRTVSSSPPSCKRPPGHQLIAVALCFVVLCITASAFLSGDPELRRNVPEQFRPQRTTGQLPHAAVNNLQIGSTVNHVSDDDRVLARLSGALKIGMDDDEVIAEVGATHLMLSWHRAYEFEVEYLSPLYEDYVILCRFQIDETEAVILHSWRIRRRSAGAHRFFRIGVDERLRSI